MAQISSPSRWFTALLLAFCLLATPAQTAEKTGKLESELVYKATVGTPGEIKKLLEEGAKPDKAYNTENAPALALAAQRKDKQAIPVMGALIAGGANINIRDGYGASPLFYAARAGLVENVHYLLEKGAVYYQTDRKGNIARSIAHAEGHDEVVKVMDDFVNQQTKSVMNAYADREKKIAENYQKLTQQQTETLKEAVKIREEATKIAPKQEPKEIDAQEFATLIYDLSYHSCAVAYWEFCRQRQMQTELGHEGVRVRLEAHEWLRQEAAETLKEEYGAKNRYVKRIVDPSANRVVEQFRAYPTNAHLKGAGVGDTKDMDARCSFIAEGWDIKPKKRKKARAPAAPVEDPDE